MKNKAGVDLMLEVLCSSAALKKKINCKGLKTVVIQHLQWTLLLLSN